MYNKRDTGLGNSGEKLETIQIGGGSRAKQGLLNLNIERGLLT